MKRTNCGACGDSDLGVILDLGLSPVADAYTETAHESSTHYPLQLAACGSCGLVQLLEVLPQEVLFGTGYSFYSSASAPLSAYHRRYADDIVNRFNWSGTPKFVVELGCNDGDMLRHFTGIGAHTLGIDPAVGPASYARNERGLDVEVKPFTRALALEIHAQRGPADIIIANHVLAHVEDVSNFIAGVAELLSPTGVAYVEVQYLPDLLLNNAFDLVYHEHRNFFTLTSLERVVEQHGMRIIRAELTDRQGGSLRVTLAHGRKTDTTWSSGVVSLRQSEDWLTDIGAYGGLQHRAERIKTRLLDILDGKMYDTGKIAGYGAPAKATTLLNFCGISEQLEFVIDTTVAKQGRFIPGTGIPIVSRDYLNHTNVHTMLLLAWNYAGHIMRNEWHWSVERGGNWIVPIPVPTVI